MRIKDIIFSPYTMVHSIHLLLVLKVCKVKVKIHVLYRLFYNTKHVTNAKV